MFQSFSSKKICIVVACLSKNSSMVILSDRLEGFLLKILLDSRHVIAADISKDFLRAPEHFTAIVFLDALPDASSVGGIRLKSPLNSFWLQSNQSSTFYFPVRASFEYRNSKAAFSAEF
jgi:hypothetical protein